MYEYIFISLFFIIFSFFIYIKLSYPFWNNQPVFHTYDYWRRLFSNPYIVYKYRPVKTKFCDFTRVNTIKWGDNDVHISQITDLLQCYYFNTERILHNIVSEDLNTIFSGQSESSFYSLYSERHYINPQDSTRIPIGCICARHATLYFREHSAIPIYFIDFLCIHQTKSLEKDTKRIQRTLLQTHEYNQRIQNTNIAVSIFKKEIELFDGTIPVVSYFTNVFYLRNLLILPMPPHFEVIEINQTNNDLLIEFLYIENIRNTLGLDIMVVPDIGNILALVKQKLLYVFCLRNQKQVFGVYFIKDPKMQYDDIHGNSLQLTASISNTRSSQLFYLGFMNSLKQIIHKYPEYKILLIENIGHNQIIYSKWRENNTPIFENQTAYYSFNYIIPTSPISPEKCFFLL